ncbi:uracil-DNA glycosylase [Haloarculaceae archaeon H-GB2-1]|nr:uracil-DNA glycosylase [Haloarculaceae archaeon H-GB1-1]MEA5386692.1 uracil-DNA glycosylase [Haloarculaceae archaeon H-GB11]MEA5408218.1 uracil-DNA glycosylase [Haloarculaceae archaeon H-GB2-1]
MSEDGTRSNPFGMDVDCTNCEELCETRETVVHGYGDVAAEFVVIGEAPSEGADESGIPFTGADSGILDVLSGFDMCEWDDETPVMDNVFLTYVTRCRHPERPPTDAEVSNCDPFLTSELRMINPEIIVAVGQRPLEALAFEYTTRSADDFDVEAEHATTVRGRGFEILPVIPPREQTDEQRAAFVDHLSDVLGRDYRQTKGRRGR